MPIPEERMNLCRHSTTPRAGRFEGRGRVRWFSPGIRGFGRCGRSGRSRAIGQAAPRYLGQTNLDPSAWQPGGRRSGGRLYAGSAGENACRTPCRCVSARRSPYAVHCGRSWRSGNGGKEPVCSKGVASVTLVQGMTGRGKGCDTDRGSVLRFVSWYVVSAGRDRFQRDNRKRTLHRGISGFTGVNSRQTPVFRR